MVVDKPLSKRNILMFAPSFFHYEKGILKKLEELGANVKFYDERPSNKTYAKAIIRFNKKLAYRMIKEYYSEIYSNIKGERFDYILFFQAEATPRWFLKRLREDYPDTKKILYLWDSVTDKPMSISDKNLYDEVFTFDPYDSKKYKLNFRPLFYLDSYFFKGEKSQNAYRYDFSFIGTIRRDRFNIMQALRNNADLLDQQYFIFYYLQSRLMYLYYKYVKGDFKGANIKDFSFAPLEHKQIQEVINDSRILIDIQKPHQVGLTMRTLELLASKKKFVTTNEEICKYNFYNAANIQLLSRRNPEITHEFINKRYEMPEDMILEQYSIEYFLKEILGLVPLGKYYHFE